MSDTGQRSRPLTYNDPATDDPDGMRGRPMTPAGGDTSDGQHRAYNEGAPGEMAGQTSRNTPGANVGQTNGSSGSGGWPSVPATRSKRGDGEC